MIQWWSVCSSSLLCVWEGGTAAGDENKKREGRMRSKIMNMLKKPCHPLPVERSSSFISHLIPLWCSKERFKASFIPMATFLYSANSMVAGTHCRKVIHHGL